MDNQRALDREGWSIWTIYSLDLSVDQSILEIAQSRSSVLIKSAAEKPHSSHVFHELLVEGFGSIIAYYILHERVFEESPCHLLDLELILGKKALVAQRILLIEFGEFFWEILKPKSEHYFKIIII